MRFIVLNQLVKLNLIENFRQYFYVVIIRRLNTFIVTLFNRYTLYIVREKITIFYYAVML